MYEKVESCFEEINSTFFANFSVSKETLISDIDNVLRYLEIKHQEEKIEFVHGIGNEKLSYRGLQSNFWNLRNVRKNTIRITSYSKEETVIPKQILMQHLCI